MNESDAIALATRVKAHFPGQGVGEAEILALASKVKDYDYDTASEAFDLIILRAKRWPTFAEFREALREVMPTQLVLGPPAYTVEVMTPDAREHMTALLDRLSEKWPGLAKRRGAYKAEREEQAK